MMVMDIKNFIISVWVLTEPDGNFNGRLEKL